MTDGVDQACSLINAPKSLQFPVDFFDNQLPSDFLPVDFEKHVVDAIMAGERYDPTLDLLPKKFDPILFWVRQRMIYGIPVLKKKFVVVWPKSRLGTLFQPDHPVEPAQKDYDAICYSDGESAWRSEVIKTALDNLCTKISESIVTHR